MTEEKIIKSADRVKNNGEVFTPNRIVKMMLAQPEIQAKFTNFPQHFWNHLLGKVPFLSNY